MPILLLVTTVGSILITWLLPKAFNSDPPYGVAVDIAVGTIAAVIWAVLAYEIISPAIGLDRTIYIGSDDMNLYSLGLDGVLNWKYQTGGIISSSPSIGPDGGIYIASCDGYLYALNSDGTLKWGYLTADYISYSSPVVLQKSLQSSILLPASSSNSRVIAFKGVSSDSI